MLKRKHVLFVILFTLFPVSTHAQVLLSEIAWMGTDADSGAEWIELYNFSDTPTDLTGYTLTSGDGALSLALLGTLNPHDVVLLERGSDASVPGVTALLVYDGELSDQGTSITLKDALGVTSDSASGGSGWAGIGGSATAPVRTAQRTRRGEWVTALPTPGADNAQVSDPMTPGTPLATTTPTETAGSSSGGGGGSSRSSQKGLTVTLTASTTMFVGKPGTFTIVPSGVGKSTERTLSYYWNFGDTGTSSGKSVTHTFGFPGTYLVVGEASSTRKVVTHVEKVEVLPTPLSLTFTDAGDVRITNEMTTDLTLDGYTLTGEGFAFTFPRNSFIIAGGTITLPRKNVENVSSLTLSDGEGESIITLSRRGEGSTEVVTKSTEDDTALNMLSPEGSTVRASEPSMNSAEPITMHTSLSPVTRDALFTALTSHTIVYRFFDLVRSFTRFS